MSSAWRYLQFLYKSHSRYAVHSPFVYDLIEEVLRNRKPLEAGYEIERLRVETLKSELVILKQDYGSVAGHKAPAKEYRVGVKQIAARSTLPARRAKQLHRLVKFTGSKNVLEIGTSLGFTTAWLAKAIPNGFSLMVTIRNMKQTRGNVWVKKVQNPSGFGISH